MPYRVDFTASPSYGPVGGGTPVYIDVIEAPDTVVGIKFGSAGTAPVFVSPTGGLMCISPPGTGKVTLEAVRMPSVPYKPAIDWAPDPSGYRDLPARCGATDQHISGVTNRPEGAPARRVKLYVNQGSTSQGYRLMDISDPVGDTFGFTIPANTFIDRGNGAWYEFKVSIEGDGAGGEWPCDSEWGDQVIRSGVQSPGTCRERFYAGPLVSDGIDDSTAYITNALIPGQEDRLAVDFWLQIWGGGEFYDVEHQSYYGAGRGFEAYSFHSDPGTVFLKMSTRVWDPTPPAGWVYHSPAGDYVFEWSTGIGAPDSHDAEPPSFLYQKRPPKLYVHT